MTEQHDSPLSLIDQVLHSNSVPLVMACSGLALQFLHRRSSGIRSSNWAWDEPWIDSPQRPCRIEFHPSLGIYQEREKLNEDTWASTGGEERNFKYKTRIEQICPLVYFLIKQPLFKGPKTYAITSQWGSFLSKWVTNQGGHASCKSMQGPPCLVTVGGQLMRMLEAVSSPFTRSSSSFRVAQLAPWSPAGLISAPGRGSPCIGIVSSTCWRDALFITSFISPTLFFMSYNAMLFLYEELLDLWHQWFKVWDQSKPLQWSGECEVRVIPISASFRSSHYKQLHPTSLSLQQKHFGKG